MQRIQQDEYHKKKAILISVKTEGLGSYRVTLSTSFRCQMDTSKEAFSPKFCMHAPHLYTSRYSMFKSHFTVVTSGDLYESRYSLLWNIWNRSLPSLFFFFCPNIFLNTFSSDIYICCSSAKTEAMFHTDKKTASYITFFCILIFRILNIGQMVIVLTTI